MKFILPLVAVAALSACAETDSRAIADAAVIQIQALNAAGTDPVSLSPENMAFLSAGCVMVQVVYPDVASEIAAVCDVVTEVAQ